MRLPTTLALSLIVIALALLTLNPQPGMANWPGQNGRISFLSFEEIDDDLQITLKTMDPDGSHRRIVYSSDSGPLLYPSSWSADGTKLVSVTDGNIIHILTLALNELEDTRTIGRGQYPSWIPDNQSLIASVDGDLMVLDMQGQVIENLTNTPNVEETDSALSPDISTIVFTSNEDPNGDPTMPPVAGPNYNLWTMNANGTNRKLLFQSDNPDIRAFRPDWKPDASTIVFSDKGELWTIAPNGASPTQLTNSVLLEVAPTWSPDGTLILYNQGIDSGTLQGQVWTIDPVTRARKRVTPDPATQADFAPAWQTIGHITAPNYYVWGASTCGPRPALADVLATLKKAAGLTPPVVPKCPPMGQSGITSTGVEGEWGNVDCTGAITADDAFLLLQYILEVGPFASDLNTAPPDCVPIDTYLQWIATS